MEKQRQQVCVSCRHTDWPALGQPVRRGKACSPHVKTGGGPRKEGSSRRARGWGAAALERKTIRQYALGKQRQGQLGVGGGCRAADGRMRQCDQRRVLICGAAGWAKNLVVVRL